MVWSFLVESAPSVAFLDADVSPACNGACWTPSICVLWISFGQISPEGSCHKPVQTIQSVSLLSATSLPRTRGKLYLGLQVPQSSRLYYDCKKNWIFTFDWLLYIDCFLYIAAFIILLGSLIVNITRNKATPVEKKNRVNFNNST